MATLADVPRSIGIVLAGGQSSRMGRDKAMLSWNGRPLIEHQLAALRAAGVDEARVSGHHPDYDGIADALSHMGPLSGLAGVAAELEDDVELLVIPVDMPLLTPSLLQRLRTMNREAACLRYAGHVLPMRLRLDARCRARLDGLLHESDPRRRSLRALQHAVGVEEIALPPDEATQLTDCNTEAIWREVSA
ncbi:MAG TPA: molybdenum cofactor guanylyltransferase [Rhodanobacteraceae bacterium]|nr:molybdenum cofactor guanylyltransferase [Rhodanobacteraceae bacterium]